MARKRRRGRGKPRTRRSDSGPKSVRSWAVDPTGRLIVVDEVGNRLFVQDGEKGFRTVGAAGNGPGEFRYPRSIALDGEVAYVADSWNHRIQVFRVADWTPIRSFGSLGVEAGDFFCPSAARVIGGPGPQPWLVVADTNNRRLSFHERSGEHLFVVDLDESEFPVDVAYRSEALEVKIEDGTWRRLHY